jgi:peptidoglycan hydrolase-like protein with peptidoglycan-binding domain
MENMKFQIVTSVLVVVLVIVGFLSLRSLRNPASYAINNGETVGDIKGDDALPTPTVNSDVVPPATTETPPLETPPTETEKYADLIAKLETAKSSGTVFKTGSKGASVSAIQEFLALYEKKTTKPDGDYGDGTATRVKAFQKASGISPQTGQTASKTLTAMIEWLKKNG